MRMAKETKDKLKFDARKCPECGSGDVDLQSGEYFCKKCGMVID